MPNTGYFTDSISNQPWFRCLQCPYDVFSEESIQGHVAHSHAILALPEAEGPIEPWIEAHAGSLGRLRVGLGLLTWNTKDASVHAAKAIAAEQQRLAALGVDSTIFWADNGSTDGTQEALRGLSRTKGAKKGINTLHSQNMGQSIARNDVIGIAMGKHCDFLLMVDGDVEIVPYSAFAMARYLLQAPQNVGCVGMYCRNCTHDGEAAQECRCIDPWMVDEQPSIAWTNYGMFRADVLKACKFEESGPFGGPGWGFEDDDYQMQMTAQGWKSVNTKYFRHMHRRRHSSVGNLGLSLAAKVHAERKAFLLSKWRGVEAVAGHLRLLENQSMPVLEY